VKRFETVFRRNWEALIKKYPVLAPCEQDVQIALRNILERVTLGGKVILGGNGGSAADAEHIAGELMKSFKLPRPLSDSLKRTIEQTDPTLGPLLAKNLHAGIPAIVLSSYIALSTAFMNDVDPYMVYAQQLQVLGTSNDVFMGISTSGNARNLRMAAIVAKAKQIYVIGLTGATGGLLAQYCDVCIRVPLTETYEVQELHLPLYHMMCLAIEDMFWGPV